MAVQAQYPSNAFSPDFRTRIQSSNLLDELQMLQGLDSINNNQNQLLGSSLNHGDIPPLVFSGFNNNETVFSGPQSELTCIASGSKKRIRDDPLGMAQNNSIGFAYPNLIRNDLEQSRLIDSAGTSTSGRPVSSSSPVAQDIAAHLYRQSFEIDAIVRLQNERLRLGLEQAQKRHCMSLITVLQQQVLKKLKEKETELENANRRNAELEEKVRQMSAENQIWFNVAKNNEAIVSSLRSSLEQVLLQNTVNVVQAKEGYGDSEGTAFPADDAQSCCFEGEEERTNGTAKTAETAEGRRRMCKMCGYKDVGVLVLPCRHLCLCKDCESKADTCPICQVSKNASLQIFMS